MLNQEVNVSKQRPTEKERLDKLFKRIPKKWVYSECDKCHDRIISLEGEMNPTCYECWQLYKMKHQG